MKKIKIITAVISAFAVLLASFGALAVDTLDVSTDIFTGKVTVTAVFGDCPEAPVSLHVVPADADISEMSDVSYAVSQLVYANQKMSDSTGTAVFEFSLKADSGSYVVRAHSTEKTGPALQKTVNYSNANELQNAWDNLTSDPQSNLELILNAANCSDETILSLKDDSALMDTISAYDNIGELNTDNINALIARIKADCKRINTFRKTAEIIKNADNVSQVKAALGSEANAEALGISDLLSRYNALKNTRPVDLALMGKTYTAASDFRTDFLSALKAAERSESSSQGSSSFGGGSSSGKGSAILGTAVSVQPPVSSAPFADIDGVAWAKEAIEDLYAKNIINGKSQGIFAPNDFIRREEFVKMVVSLLGLDTSIGAAGFADVDSSAWYAPYVAAAVKEGFITGYSNTMFGTGDYITRQDVAVILSRVSSLSAGATVAFSDEADISDYATDAVAKLSANGIINGSNGAFMPKNYSTRAETACMIYRLAAMMKEGA